MAKIKIIFYKPRFGDGHWLDNAISLWTWLISAKNRKVGPYSHVEIWTPDFTGLFRRSGGTVYLADTREVCYKRVGKCWTSTMRGKDNGTVKRPAREVIQNPKRWDVCEVEVTGEQYTHLLSCMKIEVDSNIGYAKKDLLKFIVGVWHDPDESRNICSEFVNNMLYFTNVLTDHCIVSPRRLAYKLIQSGYEIKPMN